MKKIAIYTCICGNYDKLIDQSLLNENFDYFCFSNRTQESKTWKIINTDNYISIPDNSILNRFFKWNPHILFKNYDFSVYIDGNLEIISDSFYKRVLELANSNCKISISKHPLRNNIYQEAKKCIEYGKDDSNKIKNYIEYINKTYTNDRLLYQNGLIFRKHNDDIIIKLDKLVYSYIIQYTRRDQLILPYIRQQMNINITDFNNKVSFIINGGQIKERNTFHNS